MSLPSQGDLWFPICFCLWDWHVPPAAVERHVWHHQPISNLIRSWILFPFWALTFYICGSSTGFLESLQQLPLEIRTVCMHWFRWHKNIKRKRKNLGNKAWHIYKQLLWKRKSLIWGLVLSSFVCGFYPFYTLALHHCLAAYHTLK